MCIFWLSCLPAFCGKPGKTGLECYSRFQRWGFVCINSVTHVENTEPRGYLPWKHLIWCLSLPSSDFFNWWLPLRTMNTWRSIVPANLGHKPLVCPAHASNLTTLSWWGTVMSSLSRGKKGLSLEHKAQKLKESECNMKKCCFSRWIRALPVLDSQWHCFGLAPAASMLETWVTLSKHQNYLDWCYSSSRSFFSVDKVEGEICIYFAHAIEDLKV